MSLPRVITGGRRARFGFLVANGVCQAAVAVATARLVQNGFDRLVTSDTPLEMRTALLFGGGLTATILIGAWLRWRGNLDAEKLGQSYVHAVRILLFRHVAAIGADGARQKSKGAIMLRFVGDLTALRQWVSLGLAGLSVSGLATILALGTLSVIEPVIAVSVTTALVVATALALAIGRRLRATTREARRRRGRLAAMLNDRISRIGVVEAFGQEDRERRRFEGLSRRVRSALIARARVIGLLRALSEASASFASMCALFVGAIQVAAGHASPGAVVAAMVVAGLLAPRLNDLGRVYQYWNGAVIARRKQEELLELQPLSRSKDRDSGVSLEAGPGRIELDGISRAGIFENLNVTIEAGARVALVGPNGSGKSTLLRLTAGIIDPDQGRILLDGQDLTACAWADVRQAFAIVSPDLPLLRGSLRLNLTYGAKKVTDAEIMQTMQDCGLAPLFRQLPNGLKTRISENGEGFSTGQRARIALARALLVRPRVLLLDEAEANLDSEAREALDRVIHTFEGTVIFVTQDLANSTRADRVLRIETGGGVASETPAAHLPAAHLDDDRLAEPLLARPLRAVS